MSAQVFANSVHARSVLTGMLIARRVARPSTMFAIILFLTTVLLGQVSITGKWQGTTGNGMRVVLDLKTNDDALTGTVTREGESAAITDGKVSRTSFKFNAVLGDEAESLTGEVDGQQLKVWLDRQGREGAVVFNRIRE